MADALVAARQKWESDRFAPERDEPEHVLVFGAISALDTLGAAGPGPGEQHPQETSRFGVLARTVWDPLLAVEEQNR